MNKVTLLIVFCHSFFLTMYGQYSGTCNYVTSVPIESGECLTGDLVLVFEDEFDGNQIDDTKWYTEFGYGNRCHGDEPQVYLDENVILNNGELSLLFKEQPGYYHCGGTKKWKQYSSGMIYSKSKYLYGVFEAEVKIPSGTGYWPAFWLWHTGGEIDIFEFYDDETAPEFSTHKWPEDVHHRCTHTHTGLDYSLDYHTYTVYWDPYFIAFFIDGDLKYVHWLWYTMTGQSGISCNNLQAFQSYVLSKSYPSPEKEHIILNLAGQENKNPSPLNETMDIRYVRAWQKKENMCVDKTISHFNSDHIEGKSIIVDGNITVSSDENIRLTAENSILLNSDLTTENDAFFEAKIHPNLCSNHFLRSAKIEPNINLAQIDSLKNISNNGSIVNNSDLVLVYPNPVTSQLNIFMGKVGKLDILDISGNTLYTLELDVSNNIINMNNFNEGLYIVRVVIGDEVYSKKIIKK